MGWPVARLLPWIEFGLAGRLLCYQHGRQVLVAGAVYELGLPSVFEVLLSQTLVNGQLAVFRLGGP